MHDSMEPMFKANHREGEDNTINIDKLYSWLQEYWISVIVCIVASFIVAAVYLRYAVPKYIVHAKVLIKSEQRDASNGALLEELGMGSSKNNVENEVEIFKSRILMQRTIQHLHLNIQYYVPGKITTTNLYNDAPFKITPLFHDSLIKTDYSYTFRVTKDGNFNVSVEGKTIQGHFGDIIQLPLGKVIVEKNIIASHLYDETREFIVILSPVESLVDRYVGELGVELISKQVSILNLSFKDVVQQRGEDILNRLIDEYQLANIEDKNQVAEGTLRFIEDRLKGVDTSLTIVEKDIEGFKRANKIIDVESQSKLLLENTGDNIKELTQKEVQLKILESLDSYLRDNNNMRRVMPATLITQDITLAKIIEEYNGLQAARLRLLRSYTETSPPLITINTQIDDAREGMQNYIASLRRGYEVSVKELKAQGGIIDNKLIQVPEKQRVYLEYARKQQITQELYLFLLKKREETAISKSATVSNLKIVDPAKRSGAPISPIRSRIYLIALVAGIALPSFRIAAKELFNNKISSRADVEKATNIPILAEISRSHNSEMIAVKKDSKTVVAEQFRALRTNLQFLLTDTDRKVISVTSSMSGEGKSFVSMNIATAIALSAKKVVLIELDLRKPQLSKAFQIENNSGFTNYITGQTSLDNIIYNTGVSDNFFFIPSGPLPPNPAELLMLPKTQHMFDELKGRFDYVIVDTAPVGLVTDAQLLGKYSDAVMYIIRQGYTYKQQLKAADNMFKSGKLPHMGLIINDVKLNKSSEYGYGNSSGYFEDEKESTISKFSKIIKRNK